MCLHILSVLTNLVLFFKASDPNQKVKKKVKINSIKHSHKSFVNIKTYELPIKVHELLGLCTNSIGRVHSRLIFRHHVRVLLLQ